MVSPIKPTRLRVPTSTNVGDERHLPKHSLTSFSRREKASVYCFPAAPRGMKFHLAHYKLQIVLPDIESFSQISQCGLDIVGMWRSRLTLRYRLRSD